MAVSLSRDSQVLAVDIPRTFPELDRFLRRLPECSQLFVTVQERNCSSSSASFALRRHSELLRKHVESRASRFTEQAVKDQLTRMCGKLCEQAA